MPHECIPKKLIELSFYQNLKIFFSCSIAIQKWTSCTSAVPQIHVIFLFPGNKSHSNNNPPPIADDLAAATMKNEQPPDDDLPPSGEAVQQVTNPENPPLYYDALAGLTSGGSMLSTTQPQGIHVSYMNGEESRKQLPAVEQVLLTHTHVHTHTHIYTCTKRTVNMLH